MITGKALGSLMAKVLKTRRLQSGDFVHINNSSAPGLLEKVAVLGDYGYTPTKQSAVPDGVVANLANRILGVGRESQQQSSDPLWNAKPQRSWLPSWIHTPVKKTAAWASIICTICTAPSSNVALALAMDEFRETLKLQPFLPWQTCEGSPQVDLQRWHHLGYSNGGESWGMGFCMVL